MEFPKLKKKLRGLLSSVQFIIDYSKAIGISAGVLSLASSQAVSQPRVPVNEIIPPNAEVKKYSSKFLLKSAAKSALSSQFAQHRSHSSHSSHRSHSSHSSHGSHYSSSPPSHASHYSSSGTSTPPRTKPTTPPTATRKPAAPKKITFGDYLVNNRRNSVRWSLGARSRGSYTLDEQLEVVNQGSRLKITPRSDVPGLSYNGYVSETPWNMTGGQVSVEVVQAAASEASTSFALVIDANNWYRFYVEGGKLYFESMISGVPSSANMVYNAAEHRFWRFRHDEANNLMLWETSSSRSTWNVRHAVTPQIPMTALYVELIAGTDQIVKVPGTAIFDNFQIVLKR